jgi:hypothetical protein
MGITEELRKWAHNSASATAVDEAILVDIADRIDAEHEKALSKQFASLTYDMSPMTDENMAKDGWVRLPVDADDVPINVGDEVCFVEDPKHHNTVNFITLGEDGWRVNNYKTSRLRHWTKPTIESTLLEMLETAVGYSDAHTSVAYDAVTECAEKLKEMFDDA